MSSPPPPIPPPPALPPVAVPPTTHNTAIKNDGSPVAMSEQPSAKKARKEDDERVSRAARLMLKSPILSVPQAMLCNDFT